MVNVDYNWLISMFSIFRPRSVFLIGIVSFIISLGDHLYKRHVDNVAEQKRMQQEALVAPFRDEMIGACKVAYFDNKERLAKLTSEKNWDYLLRKTKKPMSDVVLPDFPSSISDSKFEHGYLEISIETKRIVLHMNGITDSQGFNTAPSPSIMYSVYCSYDMVKHRVINLGGRRLFPFGPMNVIIINPR
jgi:hypothetical protein